MPFSIAPVDGAALTDASVSGSGTADAPDPASVVVLVVDDTEGNRYAVTHWLQQAGFQVRQAPTGADGLAAARAGVDLVVLDVHLPDIDGFDVAAQLKADERTRHVPVLHLSAVRVAPTDRVQGLTAGADTYLTHPVTPEELVATVWALLRLSRSERALREQNAALERAMRAAERARVDADRARAEADAARQVAEVADRAKTQFLTNMSHELRTPLNAIQGHVQLLAMGVHGPVTEAQHDALGRIDRAQRHLLGLVNDVLNFARLGSGRVEYHVEPVLVADVVADVLPMVEPQLAAKELHVEVHLPEVGPAGPTGLPPVPVLADHEKLAQVFLNLLSNAIKFTPSGGRISVELTGRQDGSGPEEVVYFRVTDTGIGLPHEMIEAVFEPFVQVRTEHTRETGGTGLGLAISRDLARGMGGDLRARSVEGEGSTFTITLRRAPAAGGA